MHPRGAVERLGLAAHGLVHTRSSSPLAVYDGPLIRIKPLVARRAKTSAATRHGIALRVFPLLPGRFPDVSWPGRELTGSYGENSHQGHEAPEQHEAPADLLVLRAADDQRERLDRHLLGVLISAPEELPELDRLLGWR